MQGHISKMMMQISDWQLAQMASTLYWFINHLTLLIQMLMTWDGLDPFNHCKCRGLHTQLMSWLMQLSVHLKS